MLQYIETHAALIYAITFCSMMIGIVLWEVQKPCRQPGYSSRVRWLGNFGVYVLNIIIRTLLLPLTAITLAATLAEQGQGLFNYLAIPLPVAIIASILILDGAHYLKHVALHKLPLFWRFHRMHHTDLDYDFTTGIRFHPFESIASALVTLAVIAMLGVPVVAVIIFETTVVAVTFFVHGNISYPASLDTALRTLLVTPDMHRIHHSARRTETDSNYGLIFSWWDRLFTTHVAQPRGGHTGMTLGLHEFRGSKHQTLPWMLACPFLNMARQQVSPKAEDAAVDMQE